MTDSTDPSPSTGPTGPDGDPHTDRTRAVPLDWHDVGSVEELGAPAHGDGDGRPRPVTVGKRELAVVKRGNQWFAFDDICPHYGTPLTLGRVTTGPDDQTRVVCADHGYTFRLDTGACVEPDDDPCELDLVPVRITDSGRVEVGLPPTRA